MKTILSEIKDANGEIYQLCAEVNNCSVPEDTKQLILSTVWSGNKHPKSKETKYEFLLNDNAVTNLKILLEQSLKN